MGTTGNASGLAKKLGLKPGMTVLLKDAPAGFDAALSKSAGGITLTQAPSKKTNCVIAFVRSKADVETAAPKALKAIEEDGLMWFAYPKKTGGIKSDLSRDTGWEPVFAAGYDSVAQVSIDDTWTGFRFRPKHLIGRRTR